MVKEILSENGYRIKVDDHLYSWLNSFKWKVYVRGKNVKFLYASTYLRVNGKPTVILMHRLVMQEQLAACTCRMCVDHIDYDGLNNCVSNLRVCTWSENLGNMHSIKRQNEKCSQYKGVYWYKRTKKWKAQININGVRTHLGYFDDEVKAAQAYNAAARRVFKEFAVLNDVPEEAQCQ